MVFAFLHPVITVASSSLPLIPFGSCVSKCTLPSPLLIQLKLVVVEPLRTK